MKSPEMIKVADLGQALHRRRTALKLNLRKTADKIGVSQSTLSRIECNKGVPDPDTIVKIADFLNIPLERIIDACFGEGVECPVVFRPNESTPDIIEAHLRHDKSLSPERAAALSNLFRTAYEQYRRAQ